MKIRLPKTLLSVVMACSLVGYAHAIVQSAQIDRPDVVKTVNGTEEIKDDYLSYKDKVTVEEHKADKALVYLKDGSGTATITGTNDSEIGAQESFETDVRLFVREGSVQVSNISITQKCNSDFDFVSVAGGSKTIDGNGGIVSDTTAKLILDNSSIIMTDAANSGYMKSATVGNRDGEGSLILKNNSVFKTGQHLYVGYTNCGNAAHGTYLGTDGVQTYFTGDDAKTGHVVIESGSKMFVGDGFTMCNADVTISGDGAELLGSSRNIGTADWASACQSRIGSKDGYTATISIEDGGAMKAYNSLWIGKAASTSEIKVDGEKSLFAAYKDVYMGGADDSSVEISATNGASIYMAQAEMGADGCSNKVSVSIDADSSYTGASLVLEDGASFSNDGSVELKDTTITIRWTDNGNPGLENEPIRPSNNLQTQTVSSQLTVNGGNFINNGVVSGDQDTLLTVIAGGAVTNSGTIDVDTEIAGGTLTLDGGKMADITLTEGTIYVNGNTAAGALDLQGGTLVFNFAATAAYEGIMLLEVADSGAAAMLQTESLTLGNNLKIVVEMTQEELADLDGKEFSLFSVAGQEEKLEETEILFTDGTTTKTGTIEVNGGAIKVTNSQTIPEPATATLSLLALAGLVARRRRAARR